MLKIMRQTNYIFALLLCLFFFSCEKEEFTSNRNSLDEGDELYINPEDTAGIVVPEGYSLVIFPGNKTMTRAVVETRIQHLQYIIYQEDGSGNFIQFNDKKKVNTDLSSWPIKSIAVSLPENHNYKVVFLGNVDKTAFGSNQTEEVLTGTGKGANYNNAHIVLPSVEFSDKNMYFLAKADFNTNATAYVPITLKRIVSRNDITKEGLMPSYANGVTNSTTYKTAYWTQTVKEKLKESIFTGENSTFKNQVGEGLKRCLIYPLIYTGMVNPADAATLGTSYTAIAKYNAEWDTYKPSADKVKYLEEFRQTNPELVSTASGYANNLCIRYAQYLYDTFLETSSKDPEALKKALNRIYTDDIPNKDGVITRPSVTKAIDKTIAALNAKYASGVLIPWRNLGYTYSVIDIKQVMPGAVDFDLNPIAANNITGEKYYKIKDALDSSSDGYVSIISLGEGATSTNKLGISKVYAASVGGTTIDFIPQTKNVIVSDEFTAGNFHRNIRSVTTQKVQNVSLVDPQLLLSGDSYIQNIDINFYNLLQEMNPVEGASNFTLGFDQQAKFTIENVHNPIAQITHVQAYILNWMNNDKYQNMQNQDKKTLSFPFATFNCPDLSPSNINVTIEWSTQEVQ